jgi:cytoskeletal protein RodZ
MTVNVLPRVALGSSLASARLARGLDLGDVERETCIRVRYLSALEEEDFDALPGDGYAAHFLRTYAGFLGLDADVYVEELRRRRGTALPSAGRVITQVPRRRPSLRRIILG